MYVSFLLPRPGAAGILITLIPLCGRVQASAVSSASPLELEQFDQILMDAITTESIETSLKWLTGKTGCFTGCASCILLPP